MGLNSTTKDKYLRNEFLFKEIRIDDCGYQAEVMRKKTCSLEACRIIIPTYMPNERTAEITHLCVQSVVKHTKENHEIWVIDNNSPSRNSSWLRHFPRVNVVFNHTEPLNPFLKHKGHDRSQFQDVSYANAIGLEIGIQCIDQGSKYVFVMHSDTLVLKNDWLGAFRSKLNDQVKLASLRKDPIRVHALHIAGMLIDFDVYKKLGLSFLSNMRQERYPDMPEYDVGDRLTLDVLKNGYQTYVFKNTFNDPSLADQIDPSNPVRYLSADRCFDDQGEVFYMHLGRGSLTPIGFDRHGNRKVDNSNHWILFAKEHLLGKL